MVEVKIDVPSLLSPLAKKAIKGEIESRLSFLREVLKTSETVYLKKAINYEINYLQDQHKFYLGEDLIQGSVSVGPNEI